MWFLIVLSIRVLALEPHGPSAVEQAQALVLKKDRMGAVLLLQKEIESYSSNSKARTKAVDALSQISTVFLTDKGQRTFEAGQSLMFETPDMALTRFNEALALEEGNVLVLANMARLQMMKMDCEGAKKSVTKAREIHPYSAELALLEARDLICLKDFESFREKIRSLPTPLTAWEGAFSSFLLAEDFLQLKMYKKALDLLVKTSEDQPKFPETYYFLWKTGANLNKDTLLWKQKYVSLCKSLSVRDKKLFAQEPLLCSGLKEVEDDLAKTELEN